MKSTSSNHCLFSVVIATYNSAATLDGCLKSLLEQSFDSFEVLISDGGSTDNTMEIAAEYREIVSYAQSAPDKGIYDAWNKALPNVKGKWVLFLGSDDCLADNNVLQALSEKAALTSSETLFIFSEVQMVESINSMRKTEIIGQESLNFYRTRFLDEMLFSHTGCLHRSDTFNTFGLFDIGFRIGGDYDFLLRSIEKDVMKIDKHEQVAIVMGQGGSSSSYKTRVLTYQEAIKARKKNGISHLSKILHYRLFVSYVVYFINKLFGNKTLITLSNIYRVMLGKPKRNSYD